MTSKSRTHAERAQIKLRQRILNGTMPGGTRLLEVALAEELEISRTPVRAALSQLAEEGLLDRGTRGGFVVRSFELAEVLDTIELRGVLEGTAARFAAERGCSADQIDEGRRILAGIDKVLNCKITEIKEYSEWNDQFHTLILTMANSPIVSREVARVSSLPFAAPSSFLEDETFGDTVLRNLILAQEQHRAILDAVEMREGARAESLAREHARTARRNVKALTETNGPLGAVAPQLALLSQ